VSGNTVKEKLAEAFSDFHCLALPIVGKSVCDYCFVVLVDNVVLDGTGGEDDRTPYRDTCTNKRWRNDIFVVDKSRVDMAECCISSVLSCYIVVSWCVVVFLLAEVT